MAYHEIKIFFTNIAVTFGDGASPNSTLKESDYGVNDKIFEGMDKIFTSDGLTAL